MHRVNCDVTEDQTVIRRLKCEKERLEKEIAQEQEKYRQTHNKIKNLSGKLKSEKDEVRLIATSVVMVTQFPLFVYIMVFFGPKLSYRF